MLQARNPGAPPPPDDAIKQMIDRATAMSIQTFNMIVEHPDRARWARLRPLAPVEVVDAGLTAVPAGTCTAIARWA